MFRNQYDNDVTIWSPQGRIHQIEYAMEAVKQGSATVALKSNTHAIIVALKRAPSELSAHQKKIIPIDDHVGISIAGLTADARMLSKFMRTECLNSRYAYDQPLPVTKLVSMIGSKSQVPTQRYGRRPFGVGLLIVGYDRMAQSPTNHRKVCHPGTIVLSTVLQKYFRASAHTKLHQGPHIFQTCPSANFFDCKAMAIGARSQSARTYLEKHLDTFGDCELEELIKHGLRALRDTLPNEVDLTTKNCSVGIVGKGLDFSIKDDNEVDEYLKLIEGEERSSHGSKEEEASEMEQEGEAEGERPDPQVADPEVVEPMDQ